MSWPLLLVACAGCFGLKALGALLPRRVLDHRVVKEAAPLLPVAVLVALVVVNALGSGRQLQPDARVAGMAVAVAAVVRRLPFLAVIVLAASTTAAIRAFT